MEIKVTISLDEQTNKALDKLIDTIAAWGAGMSAPGVRVNGASDKTEKAVERARVAKTEESKELTEQRPNKANNSIYDGSDVPKPKVSLEDLRALAADVKTKQGDIGKVKALLTEYSAKNISALPADSWDAFAAKLKELL